MGKNKYFFWVYLFFWLAENNISPYLGLYYESRGMSGTQIAALGSIFSAAVAVAAIGIGIVGDRFGDLRKLLVLLCLGLAASVGAVASGRTFAWIAVALLVYGIAYSPFNGTVDKMLMGHLGENSGDFGLYRMGGTLGAGIGVMAGGIFLQLFSFPAVFTIYWMSIMLCAWSAYRLPASKMVSEDADIKAHVKDYLEIIKSKRFIPLYLPMALWGFTETGVMQFLALHIDRCGYSASYASVFIAGAMVGEGIMFILVSRLMIHMGEKKMLILALLLQTSRALSLALLGTVPVGSVFLLQVTGGGAYACLYSTITEAISKTYSDRVSCTAHNLKLVIMRGVGTICGSLLLGLFYDWGNTSLGYVLFSAVAAGYAYCIWRGKLWT